MQMQLNVVVALPRRKHMLIPPVGKGLQFRMFMLQTPESDLLHDVRHERGASAGTLIDLQQTLQRCKLNLVDIA